MTWQKADLKYFALTKIEGDFVKKLGAQIVAKIAKILGIDVEKLLK